MLGDHEDASRVQVGDRGAIAEVGDAGHHPGPRGPSERRRVELIGPFVAGADACLGHEIANAAFPADLGFLLTPKGGAQAVAHRGQPAFDLEAAGVAGKHAQHVGSADVLEVVFPAATAEAPLAVMQHDHRVNRPVDELLVEMRTLEPDEGAVAADPGQDAPVSNRGGKT